MRSASRQPPVFQNSNPVRPPQGYRIPAEPDGCEIPSLCQDIVRRHALYLIRGRLRLDKQKNLRILLKFSLYIRVRIRGLCPGKQADPLRERLSAIIPHIDSVNFDDDESISWFHRTLRRWGVIDALRKKGAKEGDTVRIVDMEFDFVE